MDKKTYALKDAERITPLLRSITRELQERRRAVELAEHERLLAQNAGDNELLIRIDAELASHKRELRGVTKELERLGLELDTEHALRILIPSEEGTWAYEGRLDGTRFYPRLEDAPA